MIGRPVPAVLAALVLLPAGCGGQPAGGPMPAPTASAAAPSSPAWSSGPITVTHHPTVPPVPVLTGVRWGAHPDEGFDRIVFDIGGGELPGYTVRYVDQIRSDPADRPVAVPGDHHLLVVLEPAQAHRDDGSTTVTGVHRVGLTALQAYAIVGDFEGHVSIAVGVSGRGGFRTGELSGRVYLDVAH